MEYENNEDNSQRGPSQQNEQQNSSTNAMIGNNNDNNQFIQQMMMANQPILSQHHGLQNQFMFQNQESLMHVANMMNPMQVLPSVGTTTHSTFPPSGPSNFTPNNNLNSHLMLPNNPTSVPMPNMIDQTTATTLGGVRIPPVPPNTSTAKQVQIAAAAAAAEAAPPKGYHGPTPPATGKRSTFQPMEPNDKGKPPSKRGKRNATSSDLTDEQKKKLNRDRNRQHARSTRLRKKAYVNKLKELVDGLHAERSEEARKRRVAVQHLAEVQNTRRKVICKFLQFHAGYESDPRKWETILEEGFFLKQPLTPFRFFRSAEIEPSSHDRECRISRGIDTIIADAASLSVMIDNVGSCSARWQHLKRDDFLCHEDGQSGGKRMIVRTNTPLQHAVSSLSSSSGSSDEDKRKQKILKKLNKPSAQPFVQDQTRKSVKKVSSPSSGESSSLGNQAQSNNDFHDYHAKPLPDPKLGSSSDSESPTNASDNAVAGKHVCTDSSSGDDEKSTTKYNEQPRSVPPNVEIHSKHKKIPTSQVNAFSTTQVDGLKREKAVGAAVTETSVSSNSEKDSNLFKPMAATRSALPPNIARSGGITHNIRPLGADLNSRLNTAPAVTLPPFAGIGKRTGVQPTTMISTSTPSDTFQQSVATASQVTNFVSTKATTMTSVVSKVVSNKSDSNIVSSSGQHVAIESDNGTSSSDASTFASVSANYHVNEDDMLLTEDVLMCPYIFRTQDAVLCGALAECIVPGMLRAEFSETNKLAKLEMVYDAMGFMQQLERSSGNEGKAHIIPNSLETSLQINCDESRVITTAKSPYLIVSVNELWTRTTKYTQMEAEMQELSILNGKKTRKNDRRRPGKPIHDLKMIAQGQPATCTNIYYDKFGRDFIACVSSYPVANVNGDTTHILHIFREMKEFSRNEADEISFHQ